MLSHELPQRALACTLAILLSVSIAAGAERRPQPDQRELKRLSIAELMQIDVSTVGRRPEPVGSAAAATSVVTGEDIRRAGVTTIADALTLADAVHVARFNAGTWAIATRGFNSTTSNKLLVMIDGRTVYSPLFTGTFWNTVDYALEDIDRIEVVRGPGGTLWGANAVNGIVNIITRDARQTRGAYASISAGNEDHAIVEARYGGAAGTAGWRVYGKIADRASQRTAAGPARNGRERGQAGFRIDGGDADGASWMINGDAFHSADHFPDRADGEFTELDLQGRWSATTSPSSRFTVQSYYRREYRRVPQQLTHHVDVADVDGQHTKVVGARHTIVWGGGFRINWDRTHPSAVLRFDPQDRTYAVSNVFAQDDIELIRSRLYTTVGVKWEHNAFSGLEAQPSVSGRLVLPSRQAIWGSVARAVRRPSRFEDDIALATIVGSDAFESERLVASEVGYRMQPWPVLSLEATLFHHEITNLRSQDLPPSGALPLVVGNSLEGRSRGVEVAVNTQPVAWWRTHVGYSWLDTDISRPPGSRDVGGGATEANDPSHLFHLRTSFDLPFDVELDGVLRSVGALTTQPVPAFAELDMRIGWRATPSLDLWLAGQDLLHARHPEFGPPLPSRVQFERSIRAGITVRR